MMRIRASNRALTTGGDQRQPGQGQRQDHLHQKARRSSPAPARRRNAGEDERTARVRAFRGARLAVTTSSHRSPTAAPLRVRASFLCAVTCAQTGVFYCTPEPCQCNVTGHGVPEDPAPDSTSSTPCRARRRPTARRPCGRGADPRDYSRSRPWPLHARMARPPNRRPPSAGQNTALARPELSSMRTRCTAPPTSMQRKEGRR